MQSLLFDLKTLPAEGYTEISPFPVSDGNPNIIISLKTAGNMGPSYDIDNPNRRSFYETLQINRSRIASLRQEHTRTVIATADFPHIGNDEITGDGLITTDRETILAVTVADCLPIFIYHPNRRGFGIVHSGWKGTGIVADAISQLCHRCDFHPEELRVVIGPGIGSCCYKIDKERADLFRNRFGEDTVIIDPPDDFTEKPVYRLDLKQANINILREKGLENIRVCTNCTACSSELGSFRREGPERFTRMIALIGYL